MIRGLMLWLFLSTAICYSSNGMEDDEVLRIADSLITNKKYLSAFQLLNTSENSNTRVEIALKKCEIALDYFVVSLNHFAFGFKDIDISEDIMDYRGTADEYQTFVFDIESVLVNLLQQNSDDCRLYHELGKYYYEVLNKYGHGIDIEQDSLISLAINNYLISSKMMCNDYLAEHNIGVLYLRRNWPDSALPYLESSLRMNPSFPSSNYNIAVAYYFSKAYDNGLKYAQKALELYQDQSLKADAAFLTSILWLDSGDSAKSDYYFLIADSLKPGVFTR